MTTLHMRTEEVRDAANQLDLAVGDLYLKPSKFRNAARSLRSAWQGGKSGRCAAALEQMGEVLQAQVIDLQRLVKQVWSEVDQWEDEDASFGFTLASLGSFVSMGLGITNSAKDEKHGTMMDLAGLVSSLYKKDENGDHTPIRIIEIGKNEFLILLTGTVGGLTANNWNSAMMSGLGLPSDYQKQIKSIILKDLPDGATVHFAGHSQGGIMANNLSADKDIGNHVNVKSVSTFGAPVSAEPQDGELGEAKIEYRRFAAEGDIVPLLSKEAAINILSRTPANVVADVVLGHGLVDDPALKQRIILGSSGDFKEDHHIYASSDVLNSESLPFEISQWEEGTYYKPENAKASLPVIDVGIKKWIQQTLDR